MPGGKPAAGSSQSESEIDSRSFDFSLLLTDRSRLPLLLRPGYFGSRQLAAKMSRSRQASEFIT
jgi:hypothetical protein